MSEFLSDWRRFYGDLPPLSFALPKDERWVRFHALPDSKRYPETAQEIDEVLRRANAIVEGVLCEDPCWLVQTVPAELGPEPCAVRRHGDCDLVAAGYFHHDETNWLVSAVLTESKLGVFDALLRDIAPDEALRTLWVSCRNGQIFAPYDGGFDIFVRSREAAASLREQHRAWLSHRADGL